MTGCRLKLNDRKLISVFNYINHFKIVQLGVEITPPLVESTQLCVLGKMGSFFNFLIYLDSVISMIHHHFHPPKH